MKNLLTIYTTLVAFLMFVTVSAMMLPSNTKTLNASTTSTLNEFSWIFDNMKNGDVITTLISGSPTNISLNVSHKVNSEDYGSTATPISAVKVIDPYVTGEDDLQVGQGKSIVLADGGTQVNDTYKGGDFIFNVSSGSLRRIEFDIIDAGDEIDTQLGGSRHLNNHYLKMFYKDGTDFTIDLDLNNGQNLPDKYIRHADTGLQGRDVSKFVIHVSGSSSIDNLRVYSPVVPTATPKPTATTTPKPTATTTPKPTATATPKPTATATPKPTATATPKPTATATPKPTATATPKPTATATPEPSVTPSPTATSTPVPTATATPTPTFTPTVTITPTPTVTATITPTVTPTVTITVTPTVTATPVITPTPPVMGDDSVFGFNISKEVIGKLKYQVGELIIFNVNFKNTGTEVIEKLYLRDIYTTDMRVESVTLVHNELKIDVTSLFFKDMNDMDTGMILPKNPVEPQQLLNLIQLTGPLQEGEELTLEFTFKAVSKNDLVCNQAYTAPNGRREIPSSKVCVEIDAIVPVTD